MYFCVLNQLDRDFSTVFIASKEEKIWGKRQGYAACRSDPGGVPLIRESVDISATPFAKKFRSYSLVSLLQFSFAPTHQSLSCKSGSYPRKVSLLRLNIQDGLGHLVHCFNGFGAGLEVSLGDNQANQFF